MKKLFISADIEGSCGISHWNETERDDMYFREEMTKEVSSVCESAGKLGYDYVLIKDAHDSARNIFPDKLPQNANIIRNWTCDPYCMVSGIDESFDAAIFTGYHSPAFSSGSPLAHTMSTHLQFVKFNGEYVSEFLINAYSCATKGVPVVLVTGDEYLCEYAKRYIPAITTAPVCKGIGGGSLSMHPEKAQKFIAEQTEKALNGNLSDCIAKLPDHFKVEVQYKKQEVAWSKQFFPGASLEDPYTIAFESDNYYDVLVFMHFCL